MTHPDRHEHFLALLEQHRGILHKVARAYGRQRADQNDLAQEIVVQLWRSFQRYDERLCFSTWMYRIALNVAISEQRRAHTQSRSAAHADAEILETIAEPEAAAPSAEVELLYQLIARFDDLNRALMLLYLDGNSHATIAEVLGISTTNVGTKIARLKKKLEEELRAVREDAREPRARTAFDPRKEP